MHQFLKPVFATILIPFALWAQDDFFPTEPYYGGGVGFSEMFLFVDVGKLEGFELLGTVTDTVGNSTGLGFNTDDFRTPFVIYGGEGFSQITGRWRIGGYAGLGTSTISDRGEITLFWIRMVTVFVMQMRLFKHMKEMFRIGRLPLPF